MAKTKQLAGSNRYHRREVQSLFRKAATVARDSVAQGDCLIASNLLNHAKFLYGQAEAHLESLPVEEVPTSCVAARSKARDVLDRAEYDLGTCLREMKDRS